MLLAKKIILPFNIKHSVLALGTQTKNTICFAQGRLAYLSPIHQDLTNLRDLASFEKDVKSALRRKPRIIAYDLHPEYISSKFALELATDGVSLYGLQHHHAHIASSMAEQGLHNQRVIGVSFDGTGFGPDGTLWGGEFLICDYRKYKRAAYLKPIPLLGGEAAINEPWRLVASWLYEIYHDRFLDIPLPLIQKITRGKWQVLKKMLEVKFNVPSASSMGRLFDAAASLILGKPKAKKEAELAIELEALAEKYKFCAPAYSFVIKNRQGERIIDPAGIFKGIISDLRNKEEKEKIAYRFHCSVAKIIGDTCHILSKENKIKRVVLSGGVFQNKILCRLSEEILRQKGLGVISHKLLSPNDASVSLGQAAIAVHCKG